MTATDEENIAILRALSEAAGCKREPGTCRDCWGMGVIPDIDATAKHRDTGMGLWKDCPTCRGTRAGGLA